MMYLHGCFRFSVPVLILVGLCSCGSRAPKKKPRSAKRSTTSKPASDQDGAKASPKKTNGAAKPQVGGEGPSVEIYAPKADAEAAAGNALSLKTLLYEGASPVSGLTFLADGKVVAVGDPKTGEATWEDPPVGEFQLMARAVDQAGRIATSPSISIRVTETAGAGGQPANADPILWTMPTTLPEFRHGWPNEAAYRGAVAKERVKIKETALRLTKRPSRGLKVCALVDEQSDTFQLGDILKTVDGTVYWNPDRMERSLGGREATFVFDRGDGETFEHRGTYDSLRVRFTPYLDLALEYIRETGGEEPYLDDMLVACHVAETRPAMADGCPGYRIGWPSKAWDVLAHDERRGLGYYVDPPCGQSHQVFSDRVYVVGDRAIVTDWDDASINIVIAMVVVILSGVLTELLIVRKLRGQRDPHAGQPEEST